MSGKEENNSVLEYNIMYIYIMYRYVPCIYIGIYVGIDIYMIFSHDRLGTNITEKTHHEKNPFALHCIALHCIALHCIALYAGMPPGKIKDSGAMHEATGKTKYISCCGIHVCAGEKTTGRFYSRGFALKY
jgi:hypothetical protein